MIHACGIEVAANVVEIGPFIRVILMLRGIVSPCLSYKQNENRKHNIIIVRRRSCSKHVTISSSHYNPPGSNIKDPVTGCDLNLFGDCSRSMGSLLCNTDIFFDLKGLKVLRFARLPLRWAETSGT